MTPPWSRRRCTQPWSRQRWPSFDRRNSPQVCVRRMSVASPRGLALPSPDRAAGHREGRQRRCLYKVSYPGQRAASGAGVGAGVLDNWVDIIILFVLLVYALQGLQRGLVLGLLDLAGLVLSLVVALQFYTEGAAL